MTVMATTEHVTPVAGGKVHLPHPVFDLHPLCANYGPVGARTRYRTTDAEVTCTHCREQLRRRELAAARQAETEQAAETDCAQAPAEMTTAGICRALLALDKPQISANESINRAVLLTELNGRRRTTFDRAVNAWMEGGDTSCMATAVARAMLATL